MGNCSTRPTVVAADPAADAVVVAADAVVAADPAATDPAANVVAADAAADRDSLFNLSDDIISMVLGYAQLKQAQEQLAATINIQRVARGRLAKLALIHQSNELGAVMARKYSCRRSRSRNYNFNNYYFYK